ncbi:MAG: hypothetical protein A2381_04030 [Bdellovibrionales bacterium RIFOXYB1_FULL_37_110]|nr:MAG: hypothetical protein A2417_10140 [Bdellovibrionales bacterium RIFOXYC1_FULL_37_79]OFZ59091.1 MAG: hypothetical protein A2381_04030 [Bdellovibrionales bacterium RIFOXYB1_FULL_37_110]OFZ64098.1 MAG: hypothetical protein A2577_15150 [Bdellovibrionales bacterium RIFOXYD1_FULL_36_51]
MNKNSIPLPSETFFNSIDAVVLDLGGVIVNLDIQLTLNSFLPYVKNPKVIQEFQLGHWPIFIYQYERGEITTTIFRQQMRETLGIPSNAIIDQDFDKYWSALILGIPSSRLEYLIRLRTKLHNNNKRLLLLSNTNELHESATLSILPKPRQKWSYYFDHTYFSYQMGCRKPEGTIFQRLLDSEHLNPARTFFVDDLSKNVDAARSLGIQAETLNVATEDLLHLLARH